MIVSVIMPVYNGELFLRDAIESILSQTLQDFELIIVNDGSTDKSDEIIRSYADKRIVYLQNEINLKLIRTLNRGIESARGKYIARMDADDLSFPCRLEYQVALLESNICDITSSSFCEIDSKGAVIRRRRILADSMNDSELKIAIGIQNPVLHPSIMAKSDLLKRYMYRFGDSFLHVEDADLWMRMLEGGCRFMQSPKELVMYRKSSESITSTNYTKALDSFMRLALAWQPIVSASHLTELEFRSIRYGFTNGDKISYVMGCFHAFNSYILSAKDKRFRAISILKWAGIRRVVVVLSSKVDFAFRLFILLCAIYSQLALVVKLKQKRW